MKNIFKQLGESDTHLKVNNFKGAVLRLTTYYTIGVFFILFVFSTLIYGLFSNNIENTLHEQVEHDETQELISTSLKENLFDILLISDVVLLILTIIISYFLSKKTLQPLEDAYQKQKRFVANAAHELRTPLAVIKAGSEVLLHQERKIEEYKNFTQESLEEIDKLINLSNDLLFLAQNKNIKNNHFVKFSISEICQKKIIQMMSYAKIKDVSLEMNIESDLYMFGKPEDIARLILNLVKNAIDYNQKNGSVIIDVSKKQSKIIVTIKDTGIGISEADIPFIFERFYKADISRTQTEHSGTGLGLAIVKDIIEEHQGELWVQSKIGEGTTFKITFKSV